MPKRRGRDAPVALPYETMPAYGAALELHQGLMLLARRIGPGYHGSDRALREQATRVLLAAAEGGARPERWRRALQYRYGWFGTYDIQATLRKARALRIVPADAMLATDALLRMAQQALTLAAGAMLRREKRQG